MGNWERETIINFCDGEDEADVYTFNERWQHRIENKLHIQPYENHESGAKSYRIPKKAVQLPRGKSDRIMTEEQRLASKVRISKMLAGRKAARQTLN